MGKPVDQPDRLSRTKARHSMRRDECGAGVSKFTDIVGVTSRAALSTRDQNPGLSRFYPFMLIGRRMALVGIALGDFLANFIHPAACAGQNFSNQRFRLPSPLDGPL